MVEVKNQFANHAIFWWIMMPLVITLMMPMMMETSSFKISSSEVEFFKSVGARTETVTETANDVYESMFMKTGITGFFEKVFIHKQIHAKEGSNGEAAKKFSGSWNDGFWYMTYRAIWRLIALWPIYITSLCAFVIPAFIDGMVTRGKKRFSHDLHNPVVFYSATHFSVLIMGLAVFIPFLPVALSAIYIGSFVIALAGAMWMLASNFQTGV